jgi:CubicO group peptidase (beta-lactamase class C family)
VVVEQLERSDPFLAVGGLVSSVQDLAKWASFQFRDRGSQRGPVLSGAALREMHRPHFLLADWSQGWGLGWRLTRHEAGARIDHGGSLPGYMSSLMMDPASRVAVILLFNSDDGPRQLSRNILDLVAPSLQAAAGSRGVATDPTARTATPAAADLARFEGRYRDRSGELAHVLLGADGRLQLLSPEADDIVASALPLRQTGPTRFVTQAPARALTSGVESIVEFAVDGSGRATGFKVENGAYGYRRVD